MPEEEMIPFYEVTLKRTSRVGNRVGIKFYKNKKGLIK
jgi:hypothetical protein